VQAVPDCPKQTALATTLAVRLQCKQSDPLKRSKVTFLAVLPKARQLECAKLKAPQSVFTRQAHAQPSLFVEKSDKGADKSGK
jgi:hypothetical protein